MRFASPLPILVLFAGWFVVIAEAQLSADPNNYLDASTWRSRASTPRRRRALSRLSTVETYRSTSIALVLISACWHRRPIHKYAEIKRRPWAWSLKSIVSALGLMIGEPNLNRPLAASAAG